MNTFCSKEDLGLFKYLVLNQLGRRGVHPKYLTQLQFIEGVRSTTVGSSV